VVTQATASDPIAQLRELERRAQSAAAGVPQAHAAGNVWRGVGFRVGGRRLVTAMGHVSEVLHCPRLARVPGAKDWLMGIANLRGALLPVVNLHGFLRGESSPVSRDSRVLVVKEGDILSGLLVDEVFGVKHFLEEHRVKDPDAIEVWLSSYVTSVLRVDDEDWMVLDMHAMLTAPEFMQVAA